MRRPARLSYWDGRRFVPVRNLAIDWATGSNQPTMLTFGPVRSSQLRLDMTSAAPEPAVASCRSPSFRHAAAG